MPTATAEEPRPSVPVRYDYLDALRGWAILGVVAVHTQNQMPMPFLGSRIAWAGRYGVQLFFMVSAYTIFLSLDRARWDGWRTWSEFYIRRVFRILPMFWVGLALYAFVPGRGPDYVHQVYTPLDYALTAILQHGWHPRLINSLVPGGWSIAAEGAFYLLVPFCFRIVKSWKAALAFLLGTIVFAALAEALFVTFWRAKMIFANVPVNNIGEYVYAHIFTQLPVFACGMATYRIAQIQEKKPWSRWAGPGLLVATAVWLFLSVDLGEIGILRECDFFALGFLGLILGLKVCPTRLLVNPVTCYLGKISYSIYLLHFVVLLETVKLLDAHLATSLPDLPVFLLLFCLAVVGTAVLATLSYRLIERPCINLGSKLIRHRRAVREAAGAAPESAPWPLPEGTPSAVAPRCSLPAKMLRKGRNVFKPLGKTFLVPFRKAFLRQRV